MWSGDSGLTILFDDAPDPHDVEPDDPRITLVHLSCLIDDHPELGRGLDIAREYGVGGSWRRRRAGGGRPQPARSQLTTY
jgi:hypothetical protein